MISADEIDAVTEILLDLQKQNPSRRWGTVVDVLRKRLGVSNTVAEEYLDAMIGRGVDLAPSGKTLSINLTVQSTASEYARWELSVSQYPELSSEDRFALSSLGPVLKDWPEERYPDLITELLLLRSQNPSNTMYLTSARGRLASSKLLSALPKSFSRAFGLPCDRLPSSPICFLTAGAPKPQVVILVENPNAFECAIACCPDLPVAWISVYGFGASALETGDRLLESLRGKLTISAVRMGNPPDLGTLLAQKNLYFWGDLDVAGLQIFMRAKRYLPALKLSGLYKPMLSNLLSGGHPYANITGKSGQNIRMESEDPLVRSLLLHCRKRAVDQECLVPVEIRAHCLSRYSVT
jgi:hypothetical protein